MEAIKRFAGAAKQEVSSALFRRKTVDFNELTKTKLMRCLSLLDLTAIGIGSTLGTGVYVLTGQVARNTAGPGILISFLVAGFASVMAGLCYAEFGARVPKSGSAYVYSYVAVGEFEAFIIGWNMLLEYIIGTASVARSLSSYIDSLTNYAISNFLAAHLTIHFSADFSITIDLLAFTIVIFLTILLCIGVRESTILNNILTAVNLFVVAYVTICGVFKYDFSNWEVSPSSIPPLKNQSDCDTFFEKKDPANCFGYGGFLPYGFDGMMSGAATCFFAFVGFDVIATAGEEVHNPQRNIPVSIVLCLCACAFAYLAVSATLTLVCPYYLLDFNTPLSSVFAYMGWPIAGFVVSGGAVCALSASLLAGLLPLPRVIFAMAEDGLVFRWLSKIHPWTQTPLIATAVSGFLAATMGAVFDLKSLLDMMSIGTLLAYSIVALSVMILRYSPPLFDSSAVRVNDQLEAIARLRMQSMDQSSSEVGDDVRLARTAAVGEPSTSQSSAVEISNANLHVEATASLFEWSVWRTLLFSRQVTRPNATSARYTSWLAAIFQIFVILGCLIAAVAGLDSPISITFMVIIAFFSLVLVLMISRMPESDEKVNFKVHWVPFLPCFSIFINFYLMSKLSVETWIRFIVWMAIGFAIYFGYGMLNSSERRKPRRSTSAPQDEVAQGTYAPQRDIDI